jgi:hypothetical protein
LGSILGHISARHALAYADIDISGFADHSTFVRSMDHAILMTNMVIKKGHEITKNNYIVIENEDLDKIKLKTNNTIEVKEFIEADEFDPIFIEKDLYWTRSRQEENGSINQSVFALGKNTS